MTKLITPILLLAFTTTAAADDIDTLAVGRAENTVSEVASWLRDLTTSRYRTFRSTPFFTPTQNGSTDCLDEVAAARRGRGTRLANSVFEHFGGKLDENRRWAITLDQADEICKQGAFYENVVLKDLDTFSMVDHDYDRLINDGFSRSYGEGLEKYVARCEPAVDELLAAKVPPTLRYAINKTVTTVGELKTAVCAKGKEGLKHFFAAFDGKEAKSREPYIKAGIKGDKLELMVEYDGSVFLPGGAASDNLKKYAAASSLFVWLTSDPDDNDYVVHTVRKYQFKGNKLVRDSEKTFRKPRGAKLGAAAFK